VTATDSGSGYLIDLVQGNVRGFPHVEKVLNLLRLLLKLLAGVEVLGLHLNRESRRVRPSVEGEGGQGRKDAPSSQRVAPHPPEVPLELLDLVPLLRELLLHVPQHGRVVPCARVLHPHRLDLERDALEPVVAIDGKGVLPRRQGTGLPRAERLEALEKHRLGLVRDFHGVELVLKAVRFKREEEEPSGRPCFAGLRRVLLKLELKTATAVLLKEQQLELGTVLRVGKDVEPLVDFFFGDVELKKHGFQLVNLALHRPLKLELRALERSVRGLV